MQCCNLQVLVDSHKATGVAKTKVELRGELWKEGLSQGQKCTGKEGAESTDTKRKLVNLERMTLERTGLDWLGLDLT